MKTALLTFQNFHNRKVGTIGSSVIRGDWIMQSDPSFEKWEHGKAFDSIIFQKVYWKWLMQDFKGKKILDLCDPEWLSGQFNIIDICQNVHAVTTSTDRLSDELRPYLDIPVVTVPDRVNFDMLPMPKTPNNERAKTVVWYGYAHNAKDALAMVLPDLANLGLSLMVVSNIKYEPVNSYGVHIQNIAWENDTAWQEIQRADIAINPQLPFSKGTYKSNNKTVIASALGLPVATDPEELARLVDPTERKKTVAEKMAWVKKEYDISLSVAQYRDILSNIQL